MSLIKYGASIPVFVKRLRDDLQLSQSELAERMGVHAQYVSNIERGVQKNPIAFVSLLLNVCPRDRRVYLEDLMADAAAERAVERLRAKKNGKWHSTKR